MKTLKYPKVSYAHLTTKQRVEIAALLRAGVKQKDIARQLGKDPSTISREIKRNRGVGGKYLAIHAKEKTKHRRIKANERFRKIENNKKLKKYILRKLKKYWSPEQIAGRLKKKKRRRIICHETIYQWVYKCKPKLKKYLRCKKGKYRRRYGSKKPEKAREEAKKKRIDKRPPVVDKRQRIGDWEGDTVVGRNHSGFILTHVERKSGYGFGDKMEKLSAEGLADKTKKRFNKLPKRKRHTITYDNGPECWGGELVEDHLKIGVYYAYPYHSWERGCNENWNGLLRQFFPKKISFASIQQRDIKKAVRLLNTRPRKRLNYLTPYEIFMEKKNCALD
jgi:transposase, IS30 family